jgi:exodeoxyribonuclease-3
MLGYELVHHGEGRWNGVAIATRVGAIDVVTNFDGRPIRDTGPGSTVSLDEADFHPLEEARMVSAVIDPTGAAGGPIRVVSLYAPNGRVVGSSFYAGKLAWFERLAAWLDAEKADAAPAGTADASSAATGTATAGARAPMPLLLGGDLNVAPTDDDVWDPVAAHGGTHVSEPERAAFRALLARGLVDTYRARHDEPGRFTWWDYRAGAFQKNLGMRIDHLLGSPELVGRIVDVEIDREARKGKPVPSDHAPLVLDLDTPGRPFDAGWAGAEARIAARRSGA